MIKKLAALSITLIMALALPVSAQIPQPPTKFFCADFANVLSAQTEEYIIETSAKIMKDYNGTQFVVVTIESLEGNSLEDYSIELAREWEIGKKGEDNGLLILLSEGDRELRVEVGNGLEGVINDAKAGRYIRNVAYPYLKDNDYDNGILELYKALVGELENPTPMEEESEGGTGALVAVFFMFIGVAIIISLFKNGGRKPPRGGGFGGDDLDELRRLGRIGGMGGFYGGFYGGGSHRGGGFGGGGFGGGGFSGGGGSFGGGGASGKF